MADSPRFPSVVIGIAIVLGLIFIAVAVATGGAVLVGIARSLRGGGTRGRGSSLDDVVAVGLQYVLK